MTQFGRGFWAASSCLFVDVRHCHVDKSTIYADVSSLYASEGRQCPFKSCRPAVWAIVSSGVRCFRRG